MELKTLLNFVQKHPGFVYGDAHLRDSGGRRSLDVEIRSRKGSRPFCSGCGKRRPAYDKLAERRFEFVPLWAIAVFFVYTPRRCNCARCGVTVELLPWADGKSPITTTYAWFLASWAKALSWKETSRRFHTSWATVFHAVKHAVEWGKEHRNLDGITAIGVDELSWKKGHKYLRRQVKIILAFGRRSIPSRCVTPRSNTPVCSTPRALLAGRVDALGAQIILTCLLTLVYQVDSGCRRLLWIGRDRTAKTFGEFFDWLGAERAAVLEFVISDMWKAFLSTVARRASHAVHILDRFHVVRLCNKAIEEVRRAEAAKLRAKGDTVTLKKTRWVLLKQPVNLTGKQRSRLRELLRVNLQTVKAYLLKDDFNLFWKYKSPKFAGRFLDGWIVTAAACRIAPFVRLAWTLHGHRALLLNWFLPRRNIAMGAVEGLNNKARVTTKLAYGFRTYEHVEIALFHRLGNLPEPDWFTHKFS